MRLGWWMWCLAGCATEVGLLPDGDRPNGPCGDGVLDPGELCDDGNVVDDDACTAACVPAACGDGIVQRGVETCDDGNAATDDACVACAEARCGDGAVQAGVEACDEGSSNGTPGGTCFLDCRAADLPHAGTSRPMDPASDVVREPLRVHPADLDGDGTTDVAVVARMEFSRGVVRALNDGTGALWTPRVDTSVRTFAEYAVGDIDGDGAPDAVQVSSGDAQVLVSLASSEGLSRAVPYSTLHEPTRPDPPGDRPIDVVLSEMSGDGVLDAAVLADEHVVLLAADGRGGLTPRHALTLPDLPSPIWRSLHLGDVTGDGLEDLVVVEAGSRTAAVAPRTLAGNFTMGVFGPWVVDETDAFVASTVSLIDVDQDGDVEVVGMVQYGLAKWAVLDWDGEALGFAEATRFGAIDDACGYLSIPYSLPARGDLDGDGIEELLLDCEEEVGLARWDAGRADWSLQMLPCPDCGVERGIPRPVEGTRIADADGDGALDLLALWQSGELVIWRGDGAGGVDDAPDRTWLDVVTHRGVWYRSPIAADVTQDGRPDLILDEATDGALAVLPGGDQGFLSPGVLHIQGVEPVSAVLDADADGVFEPVVAARRNGSILGARDPADAQLTVGLQVDGRTVPLQQDLGVQHFGGMVGTFPSAITTGRLDADAFDDVVVISHLDGHIVVWRGTGDGSVAFDHVITTSSPGTRHGWLLPLDGDDALDLVTLDPDTAQLTIRSGTGTGAFDLPVFPPAGDPAAALDHVVAGDLDGDGVPELVAASSTTGASAIWHSTGPLTWGAPEPGPLTDVVTVATGDLNADGLADLAWLRASEEVELWLGFGNGAFAAPQVYATGVDPRDVALADLDGDGADDVVVANFGSDDLTVLRSFLP